MKNRVFTVGYEGREISEFAKALAKAKIDLLIDVRKNPISRKKGFSKHKMAAALAVEDIAYHHYPQLGVPTAWRQSAKKRLMTREKMFDRYVEQILPKAQEQIDEIILKLKNENVALLCYEADADDCHRSYLVNEIKRQLKNRLKVTNL